MEKLEGGRDGIYRSGSSVIRPVHECSDTIHQLLIHLEKAGFNSSPRFIKIENEREYLTFIEGDTYDYPLVGAIGSDSALISAAKMLRELHDASECFTGVKSDLKWKLPPREPREVICHGDFTPYNVALSGDVVVGVFDFDASHPAPRIWDVAFSTYTWATFMTDPGCSLGTLSDQIGRAKLFCDSYGATEEQRRVLVETAIERLEFIVEYMVSEAEKGDVKFKSDINNGHHLCYIKDMEYLRENSIEITAGIMN